MATILLSALGMPAWAMASSICAVWRCGRSCFGNLDPVVACLACRVELDGEHFGDPERIYPAINLPRLWSSFSSAVNNLLAAIWSAACGRAARPTHELTCQPRSISLSILAKSCAWCRNASGVELQQLVVDHYVQYHPDGP